MKEITIDEINKNKVSFDCGDSGIYFLLKGTEVVYVGKTENNIHLRLGTHFHNKKDFDSYYFVKCPIEEINEIEAYYTLKFDPLYNSQITSTKRYMTKDGLKKRYNVTKHVINKVVQLSGLKPIGREHYDIEAFKIIWEDFHERN